MAVEKGFVENIRDGYKFSHDKLQTAFRSQTKKSKRFIQRWILLEAGFQGFTSNAQCGYASEFSPRLFEQPQTDCEADKY